MVLGGPAWAVGPPPLAIAEGQVCLGSPECLPVGGWVAGSLEQLVLFALPQVKRAMVQVISAMAHHGYLEQAGGEAMIEFLVRQCALPVDQVRLSLGNRFWLRGATFRPRTQEQWQARL